MMNFPDTVKIYIVGGYVRDRLLGLESKDHDFVVVGATPQMMLDNGFHQVGSDFPVYLNPLTGDEFALARQERKTGPGYHGFETTFDPSVTLEDDLCRRDLTMNAMAREVIGWNEQGHAKLSDEIIDPFNGQADLKAGILRHVSEAFAEDPVRVLRVARFAARYSFDVAPETKELMKQLVVAGELDHLTPERVWAELEKAIMEDHPSKFFWTLETCLAKNILFPELRTALLSSGWSLARASLRNATYTTRMLILFSYLDWQDIQSMLTRLKAPSELSKLTRKMSHVLEVLRCETYQGVWKATPEDILELLNRIDAFRQQDDVFQVVAAIDYLMSSSNIMAPRVDRILAAFRTSRNVSFASLTQDQRNTLTGAAIGQAINDIRLGKIKSVT